MDRKKIKAETKNLNKRFRHNNKIYFRIMEVFMIAMVVMNIGAMVITNVLVVRDKPDIEFHEANAIQAQLNNFKAHDEGSKVILGIVFQAFMYAVYFFVYMLLKFSMYKKSSLYLLFFFILFNGFLLGIDFFNDLGYLMGVIIYT